MDRAESEDRARQLTRSPAGCTLLLIVEEHGYPLALLADPLTGMDLASSALYEIVPWIGDHEWVETTALAHGERLLPLARRLVTTPGIDWWWAPIRRDTQMWMTNEGQRFPVPDAFPTPTAPPTRGERYEQRPHPSVFTSRHWDGVSSLFVGIGRGAYDWHIPTFPAERTYVTINPSARVKEIVTAEDWHAFVLAYPTDGFHDTHRPSEHVLGSDRPWEAGGGLVPDWSAVARDWDALHITLWAALTGNQARIHSEAGWTEAWAWEGEHTIWLRWMFDDVIEGPPILGADVPFQPQLDSWTSVLDVAQLPPAPHRITLLPDGTGIGGVASLETARRMFAAWARFYGDRYDAETLQRLRDEMEERYRGIDVRWPRHGP